MTFVRIVILLFLAFYSWSMGQIPSNELNGFGILVSGLFFVFGPALYLLPTYEAWKRDHKSLSSIALLNIFLGWTVIGWIVAIVWACKSQVQDVAVVHAYSAPSAPAPAPAPASAPVPAPASTVTDELRKLAQLRDDGILSEAEFQAQKTKLLS